MSALAPQIQAAEHLLVRLPDGTTRTVLLAESRITVGRAPANHLAYPDDFGLSRQHLAFEPVGGIWTVRDLGSRNSTFVNGERIESPRQLNPGDTVLAGHLIIEFRNTAATSATQQTVFFKDTPKKPEATITTDLKGALKLDTHIAGAAAPADAGKRAVRALVRAGQELAGHLPLTELFGLILDLSLQAVGATRGVVMTLERTGLVVKAVKGSRFEISNSVRKRVMDERSSVLVMDALDDSGFRESASIVAQQIRSLIAVPLQTRENVIGLIYVDTLDVLHPFTREDLELLTVMANIAAIRIEQARLIEVEQAERIHNHELAQAAEMQAHVLPAAPPSVPGLDMFGCNLPCRTVGGDYFDYFEYAGGKTAVLVGDVSGKGMPAAFMMSSLQARIHVLADAGLSPGPLVSRVNAGLCVKPLGNRFITFFFCTIDPVNGELVYTNAGHNPPLLIRADGTVESLAAGGIPLGIFGAARYEEQRTTFETGDTLILYSDGLTEACPEDRDEDFGEERLIDFTRAAALESAEVTVRKLLEHVRSWTAGAPFADDVTVVCVKRYSTD